MTEVCETSLSGKRYRDWCVIMAGLLRFHWHLLCSLMVLPVPPCDLDLGHNGKSQSYTFCSALIQPRADFTTLRRWLAIREEILSQVCNGQGIHWQGPNWVTDFKPCKGQKINPNKETGKLARIREHRFTCHLTLGTPVSEFPSFLALSRRCPGQVYNSDKKSSTLGSSESPLRIL